MARSVGYIRSIETENGFGWMYKTRKREIGMTDRVKPGKGIDDNKDVGFQLKGIDTAAQRKQYGSGMLPGVKTGDEAGK